MTPDFTEMHKQGTFLMINVHDAGAAVIAESAGAVALGTTSSGHAYTLARRDAEGALSRGESVQRVAEICAAVEIPVSVDAENGWGHDPSDVADTINMLADVGAAGASIEDWSGDPAIGFYDRALALARVEAAIDAARSRITPFVICARAEAFLHGTPDPMNETLTRLQSFAEAGADLLFAPGPQDPVAIKQIVEEAGGPVNALIGVGSKLTMADAAELGVRRVSVGGSLYLATMAAFKDLVTQMVTTGSFEASARPLLRTDLESLFR